MHKNLVTQVSFVPELNNMSTLKGFQQIMSDHAYETYYTIYAKFKGHFKMDENGNEMKNFFKMEEVVFYLQNFSGQVTVGLDKTNPVIDMAYHEDLEEPVYYTDLFVRPLYHNSFLPVENKEIINPQEEILLAGKKLILTPLTLKEEKAGEEKSKLIINNFINKINEEGKKRLQLDNTQNTFTDHNGYLNLNYKILFHIHYLPFADNVNKTGEELKNSIFLDNKNYERRGEEIIEINAPLEYNKRIWNVIVDPAGKIIRDKNCKSGIIDASRPT